VQTGRERWEDAKPVLTIRKPFLERVVKNTEEAGGDLLHQIEILEETNAGKFPKEFVLKGGELMDSVRKGASDWAKMGRSCRDNSGY